MQGKSRIAVALRILMKDNAFPCVIHCTHGKDRTGVIIMLLLLLCDVPTEVGIHLRFVMQTIHKYHSRCC